MKHVFNGELKTCYSPHSYYSQTQHHKRNKQFAREDETKRTAIPLWVGYSYRYVSDFPLDSS
ncbi:hypothetical protein C1H46_008586 [Malus baccata]|uniref:Uncharacterized protein n=1 Tax=Malus baccata TaxID=106549 RepID=A0A540N5S2_MALBA|nr:hypothetical protein C1H46_008586 [Malus baccata]